MGKAAIVVTVEVDDPDPETHAWIAQRAVKQALMKAGTPDKDGITLTANFPNGETDTVKVTWTDDIDTAMRNGDFNVTPAANPNR